MSQDKIIVAGIQFYAHHGVPDEEQVIGHRYAVDVEMTTDVRAAGRSDQIKDTIHYGVVARLVAEIGTSERYRLMEALAERLASAILDRFSPDQVLVRVKKLLPPMRGIVDYAAVEIVRSRGDGSPHEAGADATGGPAGPGV